MKGSREKHVHNLISLVLIVKGRPEIQSNVQAHCDTLESTKYNFLLLLVSLFLSFFFFFNHQSHFASSLSPSQTLTLALKLPNLIPQVGVCGEEEGKCTNTKLNTHTVAHKSNLKIDSRTLSAQTHKDTHKERPCQLKLQLVLEKDGGSGRWSGGGGRVCFQSPEPHPLVSQCSVLEQWERQRPQETLMTFNDAAARIASI